MLNTIKIPMVLLVFTLWMPLGTTLSYAWDHGYHGHSGEQAYHGREGQGHFHSYFGFGFNYAPYNYCYNPGYYYPYCYNEGVLVSSPLIETPEIVEQPFPTAVTTIAAYPTTEITPAPRTAETDDEITVNIPNTAAGYTSVSLKRSGKGFIGPQGEYYPEFPRVSVLKVMYGK